MDIKLTNSLTKKLEVFKPLEAGKLKMYQCGPTVYDTPHIGNYRTFVMNDIIRRVFEYNGYVVTQVMNITDVDDKTIRRSREDKVSLRELTRRYEDIFLQGLKELNILLPHHLTRATEHIDDMIHLIEALLANETAYKSADGVYMDIGKVKNYGQLADLKLDSVSKHRIANDEYDKDNVRDFALWKFADEHDGDAVWEASFGRGRPGWHIECSAMSMKILGPTIDIHTGGIDLIFPHHTNEIAQSESATGKQFVNYWIHGGFMNVRDEKMAKSKGNFVKLENLRDESVSPIAFRYWLLTAHYHGTVNFTLESVRAAQNALIRLMSYIANLPDGGVVHKKYRDDFLICINDDFNIPKALASVWDLSRDESVSDADKKATLLDFDNVLGLGLASTPKIKDEDEIPPEIEALAEAREQARRSKEWSKADALRNEIESRGFTLNDTPSGPKVRAR